MKVCYIYSEGAESHHATFSGYSNLIRFSRVEKNIVRVSNKISKFFDIPRKIGGKIHLWPKWYGMQYNEFALNLKEYDILHHIYGEDTYLFSSFLNKKKTVVSFHQPPNVFLGVMPCYWKFLAKKADIIIVLSKEQKDFFKKHVSTHIELIPHGVDFNGIRSLMEFQNERYNNKICLSVGSWLRDYKLLGETINVVNDPDIMFYIVTSEKHEKELNRILLPEKKKKVKIFKNISDKELLNLYSISSLFLLPLKDGTINNALLEAMCSGLPILATGDYIPRDYINSECATIEKPIPVDIAKSVISLLSNPSILNKMGQESIKIAETLSWENVSIKMDELYNSIL